MSFPNFQAIGAVAANTVTLALRMRLMLALILTGALSLLGGLYFKEFNLGSSELRFIADFGFGGMTILGSILSVVVTAQLFYGDIESRCILPILAKPISRSDYVVGKLLGCWLAICSFIAALLLALILTLWIRGIQLESAIGAPLLDEEKIGYAEATLFALLQCFRLIIISTATAFFCAYASSSLFAVFMGFLFWLLGQLRGLAGETTAADSGIVELISAMLAKLVPDLRAFDIGFQAFATEGVGLGVAGSLIAYASLYVIIYGGLAIFALGKREL